MSRRKILLVEINEVTWDLIDPLIDNGKLPAFARIKNEGSWAAPMSVDLPPQMDPWITWTTVYTGRPQSDHNVFFLQQPPETIKARRIWEICNDHGLRVGVYGSLCSWPPSPVNGFYVPDTFAPDASTFPESLRPIQELNLTYTRSVRLPADQDGLLFKPKLATKLVQLGLSAKTMARIANQLAAERVNPKLRWRRIALQPMVNFDFFSKLYRKHRPDFASFHTNHVAHYMHTYWKAMEPERFPQETTPEEREQFGGAIEYGYQSADKLLSKMLNLLDDETVLVAASSMGQKPFVSDLKKGKSIGQLRSLDKLLEVLDINGSARALSTMSDQFNIYTESPVIKALVVTRLKEVYVDSPERPMFTVKMLDNAITATLKHYDETTEDSRCFFPHRNAENSFRYDDLVYGTGMIKSGCHDPKGIMILFGNGIRRGEQISDSNNLDIAPTLLTILGLPIPTEMTGRVLDEAFTR